MAQDDYDDGYRWYERQHDDHREDVERDREERIQNTDGPGRVVDEFVWGLEDEIHGDLDYVRD